MQADLSHIPSQHAEIDKRLTEWARWVKPGRATWFTQPMFRLFQSRSRQWDANPHIPVAIDTLAAVEVEKTVSTLPDKQKAAIRWVYVWPWVPVGKVRRELGVTDQALCELLSVGRDMIKNKLRRA